MAPVTHCIEEVTIPGWENTNLTIYNVQNRYEILYTRKMSYKNVTPNIDFEGISRVKLSNFQKILLIVKRLTSQFTKAERYMLERKLRLPLEYYLSEGRGKKYKSLTTLRALVKTWRQTHQEAFSPEEYRLLGEEMEKGLLRRKRAAAKNVEGKLTI